MDLGIAGKVALVTGGSAGIGRATALAIAAEGARVAITYHHNEQAAEVVREELGRVSGQEAMAIQYDLSDASSIRRAVRSVIDRWGTLDILVANAHYDDSVGDRRMPFEAVPEDVWRPTIRAVLEGPYLTIQAALPPMRRQGWGRIVTVSSSAAEHGLPGAAAYSAGKAGLLGLIRTLARELGPCGILVNNVMPGMTLTDRIKSDIPPQLREQLTSMAPSGHLSQPEDVAATVAFLVSAVNDNVHGETVHVTGGM